MEMSVAAWPEATGAVPARKSPSRPVDLVHLSRFTMGDRTLERELLELFCTQSVVYVERLREATTHRDWLEAAHALKGSSNAIGAWRVGSAAGLAEAMEGEEFRASRSALFRELQSAVTEAKSYLRSLLRDR